MPLGTHAPTSAYVLAPRPRYTVPVLLPTMASNSPWCNSNNAALLDGTDFDLWSRLEGDDDEEEEEDCGEGEEP